MSVKRFFFLILACILIFSASAFADESTGTLLVTLNIGKADCLLLMCNDKAYLIDAGYEYTYNSLAEMLRRYDISYLDGVFLSHTDRDHAGGLLLLAKSNISIGAWYASEYYTGVEEWEHPMVLAAGYRDETVTWLSQGDIIDDGTFTITVLGPSVLNTDNNNNNSLVLLAVTEDGSVLLTGDMKAEEETCLLSQGLFSQVDLLKVPFHGDNSASTRQFVEYVHAQAAIIPTSSQEEPDTPSPATLRRYGLVDTPVYVTQDYSRGILATLSNGTVTLEDIVWDTPTYSKYIRASIKLQDDMLTLMNSTSEPLSLSGWILYSTEGETTVVLPEDAVIPANGVLRIGTRATSAAVGISLNIKQLWHQSKPDTAILFDPSGAVAATASNGL